MIQCHSVTHTLTTYVNISNHNLWLDFIQIYTEQWLGGHYETDEMDQAVHGGAGGPLGPPGWGVSDGVVITMQERG